MIQARLEPWQRQAVGDAAVDPRSAHLFQTDGNYFLYSVETGALIELNASSYELIELCQRMGWAEVDAHMSDRVSGWKPGDAEELLKPFTTRGLFTYTPFDPEGQMSLLERLWQHKPRRLQLLLAQHCNLKCLYCYEEFNGSNARHRLMSMELAKQSVDYLVKRSGGRRDLQITFFGGEPLLNKKVLIGVVEYCREIEAATDKTFTFELITNGSLLTEEVVAFLVENRFLLMISMDGYKEMHDHNRPSVSGKDMYETILANAKRANAAYREAGLGLPVKIRANLTHEYHDMTKVVRYLEAEGFTTIGVATVDNLPWADVNLHACTEEDLDEVAEQRSKLLDAGMDAMIHGRKPSPFEARLVREVMKQIQASTYTRGLRCGVGRNTNIVDTDGNIYPCHRYGDMREYIIGNVADMALDEAKTKAYYESVNAASSTKCQDCWARKLCGGPCAWEVSHPSGHIIEPREDHCERIRSGFESVLRRRKKLVEEAPHLIPEDQSACGSLCSC